MKFFEDIEVGDAREFGSYDFTAENIKRFAKKYDPQPFHLDEEAAKKSLFGALCASGWHTAAAGMRQFVDSSRRSIVEARERGERAAKVGPSPGFKNLKWLKPVYAGDTVAFKSEVIEKRESASRPEWGLIRALTIGTNQKGERVFEFESAGFVERKPR
jgi:acyl dehydratase